VKSCLQVVSEGGEQGEGNNFSLFYPESLNKWKKFASESLFFLPKIQLLPYSRKKKEVRFTFLRHIDTQSELPSHARTPPVGGCEKAPKTV